MSFFRICSILIFVVTAYVKQYLQTTLSVKLIYERPDVHRVFEKACCLKTPVGFSLNRLQTRLDSVFSLSLSSPSPCFVPLLLFVPHIFSLRLFQASNGNDPWSVWNADPSGGSNNNWASNPEGTQTGKSAAIPWGSVSQGHPQAYQGPGKSSFSVSNHGNIICVSNFN